MITEDNYNIVLSELISEFGTENSKYFSDYSEFKSIWQRFQLINKKKIVYANIDNDVVQLGYLFSIRWALTALSVSVENADSGIALLFKGLFTSIANTSLAVIKLSVDGLDYQANILVRNLYELCFTLINIIIDSEKRKALFKAAHDENEYEVWKKFFAFSKLDSTIKEYENKTASIENDSFMNKWRKDHYHSYSSYAHNDFASFALWSFSKTRNRGRSSGV